MWYQCYYNQQLTYNWRSRNVREPNVKWLQIMRTKCGKHQVKLIHCYVLKTNKMNRIEFQSDIAGFSYCRIILLLFHTVKLGSNRVHCKHFETLYLKIVLITWGNRSSNTNPTNLARAILFSKSILDLSHAGKQEWSLVVREFYLLAQTDWRRLKRE